MNLFVLFTFVNTINKLILFSESAPASLVLLPSPSPSSGVGDNSEQHVSLQRVAEANHVVNLTRQHGGDVFKASGNFFKFFFHWRFCLFSVFIVLAIGDHLIARFI